MQDGKILSEADIKRIIAEHFNVSEEQVLKCKYSYVVAAKKEEKR